MENNPEHGIKPQEPNAPRPSSSDEAFALRRRFPGEAAAAPSASTPAPAAPPNRVFARVVLPLLVFVLVIGGIAWVMQYMPNRQTPEQQRGSLLKDVAAQELQIRFDEAYAEPTRAVSRWDKSDKEYRKEFERSEGGHFDYPFENATDERILLGAYHTSCTCSSLSVALLPQARDYDPAKLSWQTLEVSPQLDAKKMIAVPPKSRGALRVSWKGGRLSDPLSRIQAFVWTQSEKNPTVQQGQQVDTEIRIVPAVMFEPKALRIGELTSRGVYKTEVALWSATRSDADVKIEGDEEDGLVEIALAPMNKEEQDALQAKMKATLNTRIKKAWRADVTIYEQKSGRQLPQGPLRRQLHITVDGEGEKTFGPTIEGLVPGEVRVGAAADAGTVKFERFPAKRGATKKAPLWTDTSVGLVLEGHRPGYMKVKLVENKSESTANQRRWDLEVEIPPGGPVGALPDDAAIILKTQSASPRQIHIPVRGSASPG